jgi:hypothetical protein
MELRNPTYHRNIRIIRESESLQEKARKRFAKRFRGIDKIIEPILSTCAEETELMVMEAVMNKNDRVVFMKNPEPIVFIERRKSHAPQSRYYCNKCQTKNLYGCYKYCPICASKIKWI